MGKFDPVSSAVGNLNVDLSALFGKDPQTDVQEIPLRELRPFRDHPYLVKDDDDMLELARSIRKRGVLVPGLARPHPDGGYELVSGHRRLRASELAGKATMPVIVRELTDEEAVTAMVDANLQRTDLLPSERAFAYKMKMDALNHQGKKGGISAQEIGNKSNESIRTVWRYIRLTELIRPLLDLVDAKKIGIEPGATLSYLSAENQTVLHEWITEKKRYPNLKISELIRNSCEYGGADGEGTLDAEILDGLFARPKKKEKAAFPPRIREFFPENTSDEEIETIIIQLLREEARHETNKQEYCDQYPGKRRSID